MAGEASEIVLRFLAAPFDITYGGTVHGGKLLEWIDKAGYACAAGWSAHYCVTAYVGDVHFTRPLGRPQGWHLH
jgi:4-hydroxybenzoyl-CoA thioesterase